MSLIPDDFIMMHKACENIIEATTTTEGMSPQAQVALLRDSVRSLAVIQRDLIKGILEF